MASCIAAHLWNESFLTVKQLRSNVMCITFGQPFIEVPYIRKAIDHFSDLKYTFHYIYDEEDLFPSLLQYYAFVGEEDSSSRVHHLQQMMIRDKVRI